MTKLTQMLTPNTGVSSNRFINIIMVVFMLGVMMYALVKPVDIAILETILQYSLYIFVSSLSTKAAEKITAIIKQKTEPKPQDPEL